MAVLCFLPSCATAPPNIQPQVNGLVVAGRLDQALHVLDSQPNAYGPNNQLLFLLDRGMVLHLSGNYRESIATFEQAKKKIDELYTKSISKLAGSWVVNDYTIPYRGEDFEHVLLNIYQAINFVALGEYEEALVEARDVDARLNLINAQYSAGQQNVYREDAFARFLMGILYELTGNEQDLNDAYLSYRKAIEIYTRDYATNYGVTAPLILKENLLTLAQHFDPAAFEQYRSQFPEAHWIPWADRQRNAEVYLLQYNGLGPLKVQNTFPIITPDGYVLKFAFPKFSERIFDTASARLIARKGTGRQVQANVELGENIQAIAERNLENRRLRVYAKGALRPAVKYLLEKSQERNVRNKSGEVGLAVYKGLAGIYNVFSEQADLRSWLTQPSQIRIGRLTLAPGEYSLKVESLGDAGQLLETIELGKAQLTAGQRKFYVIRTAR